MHEEFPPPPLFGILLFQLLAWPFDSAQFESGWESLLKGNHHVLYIIIYVLGLKGIRDLSPTFIIETENCC